MFFFCSHQQSQVCQLENLESSDADERGQQAKEIKSKCYWRGDPAMRLGALTMPLHHISIGSLLVLTGESTAPIGLTISM